MVLSNFCLVEGEFFPCDMFHMGAYAVHFTAEI